MSGERVIDLDIGPAMVLRLAMLMTHYRSPMEIGPRRREEARKVLRRFALACEPCFDPPPLEVVQALCDDLNTPKAIALLHGYRARKEGRKLFASLRFLGFWGGLCLPDEIKTFPPGHGFAAPQHIGPEAIHAD